MYSQSTLTILYVSSWIFMKPDDQLVVFRLISSLIIYATSVNPNKACLHCSLVLVLLAHVMISVFMAVVHHGHQLQNVYSNKPESWERFSKAEISDPLPGQTEDLWWRPL